MEPPQRELARSHECICVLTHPDGTMRDSCRSAVLNPDQPFCDYCEAAKHHLAPQYKGPR